MIEGLAHGSKGLGKREDVARNEEVRIVCPHRMPIDPFSRDRDFGHQVRARKRNALLRETAQRDLADNPI